MKSLNKFETFLLFVLLVCVVTSVQAEDLQPTPASSPERKEVLAVYTGYVAGAFIGAKMAIPHALTVIGTTPTGEAIYAARFLPVLAGSFAGAVVGAGVGYGVYKGYRHLDANYNSYKNKLSEMTNRSNEKAWEVRERSSEYYEHAQANLHRVF